MTISIAKSTNHSFHLDIALPRKPFAVRAAGSWPGVPCSGIKSAKKTLWSRPFSVSYRHGQTLRRTSLGRRIGVIRPRGKSKPPSNRGRRVNTGVVLTQIAMLLLLSFPAWPQATPPDLTSLSLEDLMDTKVSSVSRTEKNLSRTAAAVFVITAADVARSGATNIPDLLRMVPGVDVAQINPTPGPSVPAVLTDDSVTNF
jgi:hypothetical protein